MKTITLITMLSAEDKERFDIIHYTYVSSLNTLICVDMFYITQGYVLTSIKENTYIHI